MPADVVDSFISAIERKDLAHAVSHLTDDCEYDNVPAGKVFGREAVEQVMRSFVTADTQVEWIVHHQVASGTLDHGVVMNERLDRFRSAERTVELPVAGLFVITHGQISLWRDYFDLATYLRETGAA